MIISKTLGRTRAAPLSLAQLNLALLAVGLAAGLAVLPAHAQSAGNASAKPSEGPYVGAALGWGITRFKNEDFSPSAVGAALGLPAGSVSGSDSPNKTGYKVNAGYRFNDWLSTEVGLVDLGKAKYSYSLPSLGVNATASYRTRAVTLAGVASLPVTADLSVYGKLGVAFTQAKNDLTASGGGLSDSDSVKKRKNNVYAGLGTEYRLTSNVSMVGEYEYFGTVGDRDNTGRATAQLVSVGLRYSF
jgi:OOP family OmpA-OmpF porin